MRFEISLRVTTPDGEIQEREFIVLDGTGKDEQLAA